MKKLSAILALVLLSTGVVSYASFEDHKEVKANSPSQVIDVPEVSMIQNEVAFTEDVNIEEKDAIVKARLDELNDTYGDVTRFYIEVISGQIFKAVTVKTQVESDWYIATFMDEDIVVKLLCPPDSDGEVYYNLFNKGDTVTVRDGRILEVYEEIDTTTMENVQIDFEEYIEEENELIALQNKVSQN